MSTHECNRAMNAPANAALCILRTHVRCISRSRAGSAQPSQQHTPFTVDAAAAAIFAKMRGMGFTSNYEKMAVKALVSFTSVRGLGLMINFAFRLKRADYSSAGQHSHGGTAV